MGAAAEGPPEPLHERRAACAARASGRWRRRRALFFLKRNALIRLRTRFSFLRFCRQPIVTAAAGATALLQSAEGATKADAGAKSAHTRTRRRRRAAIAAQSTSTELKSSRSRNLASVGFEAAASARLVAPPRNEARRRRRLPPQLALASASEVPLTCESLIGRKDARKDWLAAGLDRSTWCYELSSVDYNCADFFTTPNTNPGKNRLCFTPASGEKCDATAVFYCDPRQIRRPVDAVRRRAAAVAAAAVAAAAVAAASMAAAAAAAAVDAALPAGGVCVEDRQGEAVRR